MAGSSPFFPDSDASTGGPEQSAAPTHGYSLSSQQPRSKTHKHSYGMQQPSEVPQHSYGLLPPAPPPTDANTPVNNCGEELVSGPARYSFTLAISAAARRLHANPLPWLALAAVPVGAVIIVVFLREIVVTNEIALWVVAALILLLMIIALAVSATVSFRGALDEMDLRKPSLRDFFRDSRWGKLSGTWLVIQITFALCMAPYLLLLWMGSREASAGNFQVGIILAGVIGPIFSLVLIAWFAPTARLMPLVTVDQNLGPFEAFGVAGDLVSKRYWRVLGSILLINLMRFSGFFLCGLGILYTYPLARLAEAHMYRQLSKRARPVPVTSLRAPAYQHSYGITGTV